MQLNGSGSKSVVQQVNSTRAGLSGPNHVPLPHGKVTVLGNGNLNLEAAHGARYDIRPNGTLAAYSAPGRSVTFTPKGGIQSVHLPAMDIRTGPHGERTVVTRRPDKSVLVSTGPHRGYLERTLVAGSQTYTVRNYYVAGITYTRVYRAYTFNGAVLPQYITGVYYPPAFYGWAFYPWANPVAYTWEWRGAPWFNVYNGYFAPSPFYASGSAWLTDYFLSQTLASAYHDQANGAAVVGDSSNGPAENGLEAADNTPITPELKNLITEEVSRQLAYENAIASGTAESDVVELPSSLHADQVFVVASNLDVSAGSSQTCALSAGDVLQVTTPPGKNAPLAGLRVSASRRADCPAGTVVNLSARDLADMQNNLREQMDSGLGAMRTGQGQLGLPTAPASAMADAPRTAMPDVPLPPNPNVGALLDTQQIEARQTESDSFRAITAKLP